MATTSTEICNMALSAMGARSSITSIDEDSKSARECKLHYAQVRDECLAQAHWNFARKTETLSLLKALPGTPENTSSVSTQVWLPEWPAPPWLYEYDYPSDCVAVRYVLNQGYSNYGAPAQPIFSTNLGAMPFANGRPVRYVVATDKITNVQKTVLLTNARQAIGVYTLRVEAEALYPSGFVAAFVGRLAFKLVIPLSGDKDMARGALVVGRDAIIEARTTDGNEGFTIQDITPDWILARGGGGVGESIWAPDLPPLWTVP